MPTGAGFDAEARAIGELATSGVCKNLMHLFHLMETAKKPAVSDHALVRYCENVYKMDFEPLRDKILTPKNVKLINNGAASIKVEGGKFTIANKCITTFIPD